MDLRVDFRSKIPLSEQIYAGLLHWITLENHFADEQLPTVRELADQIQVNFNTVARVYRRLDQEGMISTQQGRGTFIIPHGENHPGPQALSSDSFLNGIEKYIQDEANLSKVDKTTLWKLIQQRADRYLASSGRMKRHKLNKVSRRARPHFLRWDPVTNRAARHLNKNRRNISNKKRQETLLFHVKHRAGET